MFVLFLAFYAIQMLVNMNGACIELSNLGCSTLWVGSLLYPEILDLPRKLAMEQKALNYSLAASNDSSLLRTFSNYRFEKIYNIVPWQYLIGDGLQEVKLFWRHDTQHNDTQHNDIQHYDIQQNNK